MRVCWYLMPFAPPPTVPPVAAYEAARLPLCPLTSAPPPSLKIAAASLGCRFACLLSPLCTCRPYCLSAYGCLCLSIELVVRLPVCRPWAMHVCLITCRCLTVSVRVHVVVCLSACASLWWVACLWLSVCSCLFASGRRPILLSTDVSTEGCCVATSTSCSCSSNCCLRY